MTTFFGILLILFSWGFYGITTQKDEYGQYLRPVAFNSSVRFIIGLICLMIGIAGIILIASWYKRN
jgi:uncharacterized protein with PQ loop repeat